MSKFDDNYVAIAMFVVIFFCMLDHESEIKFYYYFYTALTHQVESQLYVTNPNTV